MKFLHILFAFFTLLAAAARGSRRSRGDAGAALSGRCNSEEIFPPAQNRRSVSVKSTCTISCEAFPGHPEVFLSAFYWAYCPRGPVRSAASEDFSGSKVFFDEPRLALSSSSSAGATDQRKSRRRGLRAAETKGLKWMLAALHERRRRKDRPSSMKKSAEGIINPESEGNTEDKWTREFEQLAGRYGHRAVLSRGLQQPKPKEERVLQVAVLPAKNALASGNVFQPGRTKVVYEAVVTRNDCGTSMYDQNNIGIPQQLQPGTPVLAPCILFVDLVDKVPPEFTFCPQDREFNMIPSQKEVRFHYDRPIAKDNSKKIVKIMMTRGYRSGESLPPGIHRFEYTAMDEAGNVAYCRWVVRVRRQQVD